MCQLIYWHNEACGKYYNRPEGFPRALTRLGKPGTIYPAALPAEEVRWKAKGG